MPPVIFVMGLIACLLGAPMVANSENAEAVNPPCERVIPSTDLIYVGLPVGSDDLFVFDRPFKVVMGAGEFILDPKDPGQDIKSQMAATGIAPFALPGETGNYSDCVIPTKGGVSLQLIDLLDEGTIREFSGRPYPYRRLMSVLQKQNNQEACSLQAVGSTCVLNRKSGAKGSCVATQAPSGTECGLFGLSGTPDTHHVECRCQ